MLQTEKLQEGSGTAGVSEGAGSSWYGKKGAWCRQPSEDGSTEQGSLRLLQRKVSWVRTCKKEPQSWSLIGEGLEGQLASTESTDSQERGRWVWAPLPK